MSYRSDTAAAAGLLNCLRCATLAPADVTRCPRCSKRLYPRKPYALQNTVALLVTAIVLYVPANVLPIMTTVEFGIAQQNTIIQGVLLLLQHGSYPTALIIFVASVVVPIA